MYMLIKTTAWFPKTRNVCWYKYSFHVLTVVQSTEEHTTETLHTTSTIMKFSYKDCDLKIDWRNFFWRQKQWTFVKVGIYTICIYVYAFTYSLAYSARKNTSSQQLQLSQLACKDLFFKSTGWKKRKKCK